MEIVMDKTFDLLIIGSGPAGMTAGIYAARAELDFAVIEQSSVSGGQILSTYEVDNYPGLPSMSGGELANKLREHCDSLRVPFVTAIADRIEHTEDGLFNVTLDDGRVLTSKNVIAATGASHRELGIPGEEDLAGMGVSYCATCDGAFFKGADVAVIGGGDVAVEDAIYLSRICNKVYLLHRRNEFRATAALVSEAHSIPNIEFITPAIPLRITGEDMVERLEINRVDTGEVTALNISGVFVAVGISPASELFSALCDCDSDGYILAGEDCKTSLPGLFAAGDIRKKPLRQIITACADGANAVSSISK